MSDKFDARHALDVLRGTLKRYEQNESVELYSEQCFIEDVLFFLGKSIDAEKYGFDAVSYRRFVTKKIAPFSNEIAKSVFVNNLKRSKLQ